MCKNEMRGVIMSAFAPELNCAAFAVGSNIRYYGGQDGGGLLVNPKGSQARTIIHLSNLLRAGGSDLEIREVLKDLGFQAGALDNIYRSLGNGNEEVGKDRLLEYIRDGKITVERIGFSKEKENQPVQAKFYIIIDEEKDKGANNQFYIGYSRSGTIRGIIKDVHGKRRVLELAEKLSSKDTFDDHIQRRCSRIMSHEPGVKACQLGGSNLWNLDLSKLTRSERFKLYISIFEGLNVIHKIGVHQDVKPGNIVVDGENCAMFIDFDTIKESNKETPLRTGTLQYFSPERLRKYYDKQTIVASKMDDVWAAMLTICELEAKLPKSERLLSDQFVNRTKEYFQTLKGLDDSSIKKRIEYLQLFNNLFYYLKPDPKYPLDAVVYETAHTNPRERYSAAGVLMQFSQREVVDSKENIEPEVNQRKSFFSRFFG